jgi:hypothetical protein
MSTLTLTKAPVIPELDRPDADEIGDEILLDSAAKVKTGMVRGTIASARQSANSRGWTSPQSRAWTSSGRVD